MNVLRWNELCEGDGLFVANGVTVLAEHPGIGVELNDSTAKSLVWSGGTYFD